METIQVPVNLASLSAAVCVRVEALTPDSPPGDVLAAIQLLEVLDGTLGRLAAELESDDA